MDMEMKEPLRVLGANWLLLLYRRELLPWASGWTDGPSHPAEETLLSCSERILDLGGLC